MGILVLTC